MVDFAKLLKRTPAEHAVAVAAAEARLAHVDDTVFVSPSQHEVFELCKRKWAFQRLDGAARFESDKMKFGTEGHGIAEQWLRNGTVPPRSEAGEVFKQGIHLLPAPHAELMIEAGLELELKGNIVMVGFIDVLVPPHLRQSKVPQVIDHKFTSDLRYAKTPEQLRNDAQAVVYSVAVMERFKSRSVDGAWVYYGFSGPNHKPSGTKVVPFHHTVDSATKPWNRIVEQSHEMAKLRRNPALKAVDVEPTPTACSAFGGCEFAGVCPLPKGSILSGHIKQFEKLHKESNTDTMTTEKNMANLNDKLNARKKTAPSETKPTAPAENKADGPAPGGKGLLDKLKQMQAEKGAQGVNPPAPTSAERDKASGSSTVVEGEEAEAIKAVRQKTTPAPAAPAKSGKFVLLVDALVVKGPGMTLLVDLLKPIVAGFEGHWSHAEFGHGPGNLATALDAHLDKTPFVGTLVVDGSTAEARACKEVLFARADVIIRGNG